MDLLEVLLSGKGKTYVIDELDRCLHPSLTYKFVDTFLQLAEKRAVQLIVTTHESRLLDFDLLRRDEIWFVNKRKSGESDIYSLEEYDTRFDQKIDKAYLEGRYGGFRYLVQLIRSFSEEGWSNPKKILDRVIENLRESKEQFISYESLLNRIMDYLYETKVLTTSKILARNIWKTMLQTCDKKSKKSTEDRADNIETSCKILMEDLCEEYEVVNIVEDISEIIKDSFISIPENNQYEYVLDKCNKIGFQFCVTNTTPDANEALAGSSAGRFCQRFKSSGFTRYELRPRRRTGRSRWRNRSR